jgi:hypothetical protein
MAARKKTKGVSPKAPAAGLASIVAGLVAVWLGVDAETAVVIVAGLGALVGAVVASPGNVVTKRSGAVKRGPGRGSAGGYGVIELLVAVILLILLIWLVFALAPH